MSQGEVMGIIYFLAGVVIAVAVGYFFYRKSIKEKDPVWVWERHKLLHRGSFGKFAYDGEPVDEVWVTEVTFWNAGRETIQRSHVVDPIRLGFPGSVGILDVAITKYSRPIINFRANRQNDDIVFDFDFLDQEDGGMVAVAHMADTGTEPSLTGTIIGLPPKRRNIRCLGKAEKYVRRRGLPLETVTAGVAIAATAATLSFLGFSFITLGTVPQVLVGLTGVLLGAAAFQISTIALRVSRRSQPPPWTE